MIVNIEHLLNQSEDSQQVPLKIVLFGPESTGKSTLAKKLAKVFNTAWNPEFLRYYLMSRMMHSEDSEPVLVKEDEVVNIAIGQLKSELEITKIEKPVVFLDTCLHTNLVYADYYFDAVPPVLSKAVEKQNYDLFLFCDTDIPWEADEQRDGVEVQKALYVKMQHHISANNLPHVHVNGHQEVRMVNAIKGILDNFPDLRENLSDYYH